MQHQHGRKRALSAVELSWVRTLIAHTEPIPPVCCAAPVLPALTTFASTTPTTPPASKAERAQLRKLANRKSASEARGRRSQYLEALLARIDELEHERPSLLLQVQLAAEENSLLKESISHTRGQPENRSW
jgi:hypothetical protein